MLNVRFLNALCLYFRKVFLTNLIHSTRECFKPLVWREPSLSFYRRCQRHRL